MKTCTKCKQERPSEDFTRHSKTKDGLQTMCRECNKAYRQENKEVLSEKERQRYLKNRPLRLAQAREFRQSHLELFRERDRLYREENRERLVEYDRQKHRALKREVLNAYGHKCKCCGEDKFEFLTIDHIKGGGVKHRKEVGSGQKFYQWLKAQGFPQDDYQVLCANCNSARGWYGYCPHEIRLLES